MQGRWVVVVLALLQACGGATQREGDGHPDDTGGGAGVSGGIGSGGVGATSGSGGTGVTGGFAGSGAVGGTAAGGGPNGSGGTAAMAGAGGGTGGTGALPTSGGTAGVGGVPTCVPGQSTPCACTNGGSGAQVCRSDGTFGPCVCGSRTLAWYDEGIVGTWRGTRNSQWDGTHDVEVTFRDDGTWTATCFDECTVFYWGGVEDGYNPYRLNDVTAANEAVGELTLRWDVGTTQQGALRHVWLDDARVQLSFEFWNTWKGDIGPLTFDLSRL